jgi:hypothetical protein
VEFELGAFFVRGVAGFDGALGETLQREAERVFDEAGLTHAELAAQGVEFATGLDGTEKGVHTVQSLQNLADAVFVAHELEEAFACLRIVQAAEFEFDVRFADVQAEGLGGDVFDGVRLVEDDEVAGEEEIAVLGGVSSAEASSVKNSV